MYQSCNWLTVGFILETLSNQGKKNIFWEKKKSPTTCRSNFIQSIPTLITAEKKRMKESLDISSFLVGSTITSYWKVGSVHISKIWELVRVQILGHPTHSKIRTFILIGSQGFICTLKFQARIGGLPHSIQKFLRNILEN